MSAPNIIKINGKTFNKCHISNEQWESHCSPCAYCHREVQADCAKKLKVDFCHGQGEQVCYIDLGAIYGEE